MEFHHNFDEFLHPQERPNLQKQLVFSAQIKEFHMLAPLRFSSNNHPKINDFGTPKKRKIDKKVLLRIHYQFLVNFGAILGPIWDHFGRVWGPFWEMLASKFHPRTLPNPFHDQFSLIICAWIEFSSILDKFWTNFGSKMAGVFGENLGMEAFPTHNRTPKAVWTPFRSVQGAF